jgi:serine/threonine protein kinase
MKRIGRYVIEGLLGRGGMGRVYKVRLPVIDKIAALKLLDPDPLLAELLKMAKLRDLFTHEAVTMAGLNHPNIVAVYDFDEHDGKPFFVMDYFPNNLGAMMGEQYTVEKPSRPIGVDKALDYTRQILDGLDCLHDAGILHRDIKPYNVLVTARDTLKICDFGLSKIRHETFAGPANLNVGSPYYAAPEQEADPDHVDARSDLYSVGVLCYRMLTCRLPYLHDSAAGYRPPSRLNPDLDERWDDFLNRALARRPEHRFATAVQMRADLVALQQHWERQKLKSCAHPDLHPEPPSAPLPTATPRRQFPLKIETGKAAARFDLDALWRPNTYVRNDLIRRGDDAVEDRTTGLVWQKTGCGYPRTWQEAHLYVRRLNESAHGGVQNWRMPTVDELVTLLTPTHPGADLCVEPIFGKTQRWIWSIDRRSFVSAYYVDMELGFVGWQDFSAPYYVRAVSSPGSSLN